MFVIITLRRARASSQIISNSLVAFLVDFLRTSFHSLILLESSLSFDCTVWRLSLVSGKGLEMNSSLLIPKII